MRRPVQGFEEAEQTQGEGSLLRNILPGFLLSNAEGTVYACVLDHFPLHLPIRVSKLRSVLLVVEGASSVAPVFVVSTTRSTLLKSWPVMRWGRNRKEASPSRKRTHLMMAQPCARPAILYLRHGMVVIYMMIK